MCELSNDSSRRTALSDLPRGLNLTYERILRRINESNGEVQKLARRTLSWLFYSRRPLRIAELCQAVIVNVGDTSIDPEALPDISEILRCCSSLVRRSTSGKYLEFAHFTVKDILSHLNTKIDSEFVAFAMSADHVENKLAKVCLTYIGLPEFDKV